MSLQSAPAIFNIDPKETETVPGHVLGQMAIMNDGRCFRYAQAGEALTAGHLGQAPSPKTNHHDIVLAAAGAIGAKKITVTLGATAAVVDEYAEGFVVVNDATGEGTSYKILSHPAADASASLELTLSEPIANVALTTSSEVSLVHNHYNGVQESTTQTLKPVGVPLVDVADEAYYWAQSKGVAPVMADETLTVGALLSAGSSTAGSVEEMDDVTAPLVEHFVGWALATGVADEFFPVELTID